MKLATATVIVIAATVTHAADEQDSGIVDALATVTGRLAAHARACGSDGWQDAVLEAKDLVFDRLGPDAGTEYVTRFAVETMRVPDLRCSPSATDSWKRKTSEAIRVAREALRGSPATP